MAICNESYSYFDRLNGDSSGAKMPKMSTLAFINAVKMDFVIIINFDFKSFEKNDDDDLNQYAF